LLQPSGRTDGGFRLSTEDDVEKILVIRRMKPLGFTLDEMKTAMTDLEVLRSPDTSPAHRDAARLSLSQVRTEAGERRTKLARQLDMADEFISLLDRETS
ncbi:MAG: hypothetical protein ABW004_08815, partial [Aeromicrobium sp.]